METEIVYCNDVSVVKRMVSRPYSRLKGGCNLSFNFDTSFEIKYAGENLVTP
jgi:hypothetical protein